jgi:hypothetical protein
MTSSPDTKRMRVKEEYVTPSSPVEILEISDHALNSSKDESVIDEKVIPA